MRVFYLRYSGYNSHSYDNNVIMAIADPDNYFFLSHAAAEANIPHDLSQADKMEFERYGDLAKFRVEEGEITNYRLYEYQFHNGDFPFTNNHWQREKFWRSYGERAAMPHPNGDNPKLIEFFDFAADRMVTMKPGKYLKKYFGDYLTDRQIAFYAEWWMAGEKPKPKLTLGFATTKEEILRVYNDGPQSCMKGVAGVTAYAAGDLAIAYVTDDADRIVGRTLCWPAQKIYGRVYPNPDNWERDGFDSLDSCEAVRATLTDKLRAEEYVSIQEKPDGFDGARILVEPLPGHETDGYILMPYLDNNLKLEITADREFKLKMQGPINSGATSGYIRILESECAICAAPSFFEAGSNRREASFCRTFSEYQNVSREQYSSVCSSCRDTHTFKCGHTGIRFLKEGNEIVQMKNAYHDNAVETLLDYAMVAGWKSDKSGIWYNRDYVNPVIINKKKYHPEELFHSSVTHQYYLTRAQRNKATAEARNKVPQGQARPFQLPAQ